MSEVGKGADVMHRDIASAPADLAGVRQEPCDQLFVRIVHLDRPAVHDLRRPLSIKGDSSEPCHQGLPVLPLDMGFETDARPVFRVDSGLVLGGHSRHGRTVLCCKGLEHGCLHDPAQMVQPGDIPGEQVVLDDAPVNGPECGNGRVIGAVDEVLSLRGLSAGEIGHAFGFDHVPGDTKSDLSVDTPVTAGLLRVVVLDRDLIAEEPRCPGTGMSDQRLFLGEFQLEFIMQERCQALLDLLGLGIWSGETRR
jgi:hypothetical protein